MKGKKRKKIELEDALRYAARNAVDKDEKGGCVQTSKHLKIDDRGTVTDPILKR